MSKRQIGSSIKRVETMSGPRWRFRVDIEPDPVTRKRRQRTYTFKTETEAKAEQARIRTEVATKVHVDRNKITVGEYLDEWLDAGVEWRPSTRDSYRRSLAQIRPLLGSKRLQALTKTDIERAVRKLLASGGRGGKGRSPRTVELIIVVLTSALSAAVEDEYLAKKPARNVRRPKVERYEREVWSAGQIASFLQHVDDDDLVGAWHLTARGLRRGEVLGLRWKDVDFERRTIHVRSTRVMAAGQVVEGPPKTDRGNRHIPMDSALERALRLTRERLVTSPVVRPFGDPAEAYVVVDATGKPMRPSAYGDRFERLARHAGLPRVRLHDARHSAVTVLLEQGVPVHLVARFAGHDPAMTLRVYSHVADAALARAGEVFAGLYSTPAAQRL